MGEDEVDTFSGTVQTFLVHTNTDMNLWSYEVSGLCVILSGINFS